MPSLGDTWSYHNLLCLPLCTLCLTIILSVPGTMPGDSGSPLPDLRSWQKVSSLSCLISEMGTATPACPPHSILVGNSQEAKWGSTLSAAMHCTSGPQSVFRGPGASPSPGRKREEQALRPAPGEGGGGEPSHLF